MPAARLHIAGDTIRAPRPLRMSACRLHPVIKPASSVPTMPAAVRRAIAGDGAMTLWKFHRITGFDYDLLRQLIRGGRLPAVDLKPPNSRKSLVRLFLEDLEVFYDLRADATARPFRVASIFRASKVVPLKRLADACCVHTRTLLPSIVAGDLVATLRAERAQRQHYSVGESDVYNFLLARKV